MDKFEIIGRKKLSGKITVSGSKNSALPILAATLLTDKKCVIKNVPTKLNDVISLCELLAELGAKIDIKDDQVSIITKNCNHIAPYEMVRKMRASFIVTGALLGRVNKAKVSMPGGCALGNRPVNIHLKGFEKLGAKVDIGHGYIEVVADELVGNEIYLDFPSVGATQNIALAAVLAKKETIIKNCAKEPEVTDLFNFLNSMGAKISGIGTDEIIIKGVNKLKSTDYSIIPDRIEAATYIILAIINESEILIDNLDLSHIENIIQKLKEMGVLFEVISNSKIKVLKNSLKKLKPVNITTMPYPGFPTDVQPQMMVLLSLLNGSSVIEEKIFENRFMAVPELIRMGADLDIVKNSTFIKGNSQYEGATVMSSDLRAGAALVLAASVAKGKSDILRVYHIDRGYENIEKKLSNINFKIERKKEE
jgi:UDP-N-acetylglucosamine 1-carboxyvinyltransferase